MHRRRCNPASCPVLIQFLGQPHLHLQHTITTACQPLCLTIAGLRAIWNSPWIITQGSPQAISWAQNTELSLHAHQYVRTAAVRAAERGTAAVHVAERGTAVHVAERVRPPPVHVAQGEGPVVVHVCPLTIILRHSAGCNFHFKSFLCCAHSTLHAACECWGV